MEYCPFIKEWSADKHYVDEPQKHYTKWNARSKRPHIIWFYLYKMFRIGKSIETESRLVIARGLEKEYWGRTASEY